MEGLISYFWFLFLFFFSSFDIATIFTTAAAAAAAAATTTTTCYITTTATAAATTTTSPRVLGVIYGKQNFSFCRARDRRCISTFKKKESGHHSNYKWVEILCGSVGVATVLTSVQKVQWYVNIGCMTLSLVWKVKHKKHVCAVP